MIAFMSEVYNAENLPTALNLCGENPDFADPKQYQGDEFMRAEFARIWSCPKCLGSKVPSAFEFGSEDSEMLVSDFSRAVQEYTTGRVPKEVKLISSCVWNAYNTPIAIEVLNATAVKAIDGSLVISDSMPHPLREAVIEYSRLRNVAKSYVAQKRDEKREAERRARANINESSF